MGIYNTQMYEATVKASAKQRVALEVLSYHVSACEEDSYKLKVNNAGLAVNKIKRIFTNRALPSLCMLANNKS